jgi:hypothetical protein
VEEQAQQETSVKLLARWLSFNGLHGVITQKIELIIATAERASNPTILVFSPTLGTPKYTISGV